MIDVLEFMNSKVLVSHKEQNEYTILDLIKYVVYVTLKDLDDNDRFGLIIFFNCIKIEQKLIYMTRKNKKKTLLYINELCTYDFTNF